MTDRSVYLLALSADMFVVVCVCVCSCACIQAHKHIPHEYMQAHMAILDPLSLSMYAYIYIHIISQYYAILLDILNRYCA